MRSIRDALAAIATAGALLVAAASRSGRRIEDVLARGRGAPIRLLQAAGRLERLDVGQARVQLAAPVALSAPRGRERTLNCALRFVGVGASGVVLNLVVFAGLRALAAQPLPAATGAFVVAVANNFWWNRTWTFSARSADQGHRQALRFLAVSAGAFLLTACVLSVATSAGAAPLAAEGLSIAATTPLSFAANRAWTFAPRIAGALREGGR